MLIATGPIPSLCTFFHSYSEPQVNENGVFSFEDPYKFSHPNPYPTGSPATRVKHVLSPFWSDNDIRREGTVRYVTFERSFPMDGSQIMDEAAAYVNTQLVNDDQVFHPTWMIVAQWDRVHPYPHGSAEGASEGYLNQVNQSGEEGEGGGGDS